MISAANVLLKRLSIYFVTNRNRRLRSETRKDRRQMVGAKRTLMKWVLSILTKAV